MTGVYGPETYGRRWADVYDERFERRFARDTVDAVAFLLELARGGRALELGIGTGRIALPLAAQGVEVHGIDASKEMVARLRRKPGGRRIPVTMGDFERVPVQGRFRLAYVAFNTIFALLSQEAQVRSFAAVARRLEAGGAFVLQAFVPDLTRFDDDQRVGAFGVGVDQMRFEATVHDPVHQRISSQIVTMTSGGRVRLDPVEIRYAFPSELDLMALLAGLRLRERWASWRRDPFTSDSTAHVSVYEKPERRRTSRRARP
jgi:SAM-dependent methyltransferase